MPSQINYGSCIILVLSLQTLSFLVKLCQKSRFEPTHTLPPALEFQSTHGTVQSQHDEHEEEEH